MTQEKSRDLLFHLEKIKAKERRFENAFRAVARLILESPIEKVVVNGKTTYDFSIFRGGPKPVIGMFEEINSFVSYVKDAAEGGSSKEMAFVLVGEPGNGKTFLVEFLCQRYREFLSTDPNRKYTFCFTGLDLLDGYGKIRRIESQTYEDPMVLAMNLMESREDSRRFLADKCRFSDEEMDGFFQRFPTAGGLLRLYLGGAAGPF